MSAPDWWQRRKFRWTSSVSGDPSELEHLDRAMHAFYSEQATRTKYQIMVDAEHTADSPAERAMRSAILARQPASILEVGCGSGRAYQRLLADGFTGLYTGLEVSPDMIDQNRAAYPQGNWICASLYTVDLRVTFDVVFAYFVLEHCVYPAKALDRMTSLVRPGGALVLVFPDFAEMGCLPSQPLGFVDGRAKEFLRRGDVVNAFVNLYDARIRLPRALRRAAVECGPFPINLRPRCLVDPERIEPDVDAVYISSLGEVRDWALGFGLNPSVPAGAEGNLGGNTLIELQVPANPDHSAAAQASSRRGAPPASV